MQSRQSYRDTGLRPAVATIETQNVLSSRETRTGGRPVSRASVQAFSLIELMIVISMLAIVFSIMIPLMNWTFTSTHAAQRQTAANIRFDGTVAILRTDVFSAVALKRSTPKALALTQPDGRSITWQIGPGDSLTRNKQRWNDLGITDKTTFVADGAAIKLVIPPRTDGSQKALIFFSQTAAFAGAQP